MKKPTNNKVNYKSYILSKILSGFIFALPLIIILLLFIFLFRLVVGVITPFSQTLTDTVNINVWILNLFALLILVGLFLLIGVFVSTARGQKFFLSIENNIFSSIPLYNTIKNIINQFTSVEDKPFEEVVLIDVYHTNSHMVGFIVERMGNGFCIVYVPTAPNPTNGFVYHAREDDLIKINTSTDKAMATVIGIGAGSKAIFKGKAYEEFVKDAFEKKPVVTPNTINEITEE
ncbi:putative membrane protein [Balneicella halophila]|uniref:Putative membrane protein n=1 Tax=Balneicella halophila TaxID=1537566 RepID=A0A7L4UN05_BALHA|nr:DUF502 domain-containing protein [Balneicella halophila]PVX50011.1 putative membrane protein [Balneicella halophila]